MVHGIFSFWGHLVYVIWQSSVNSQNVFSSIKVESQTCLETQLTGVPLHNMMWRLLRAVFFFSHALWTLYCSTAYSLHCAFKGNKSPPETQRHTCAKKKVGGRKNLGQGFWVGPANVDMVIREAHWIMALLLSVQNRQISRYCQHCCFIHPHII